MQNTVLKEITCKKVNVKELQKIVSSLKKIDKFIYLSVNSETINSSVYVENKTIIKVMNIPTSYIFDSPDIGDSTFKLSFFDADRLNEVLNYFKSECKATMTVSEIEGEMFIEKITLFDDFLKITINCAEPTLGFLQLDAVAYSKVFNIDNPLVKSTLYSNEISDIKKYFKLDNSSQYTCLRFNTNGLFIKGVNNDSFTAKILDGIDSISDEIDIFLFKNYFDILDSEDYEIYIYKNKVIFKSLTSDTEMAFATVSSDTL